MLQRYPCGACQTLVGKCIVSFKARSRFTKQCDNPVYTNACPGIKKREQTIASAIVYPFDFTHALVNLTLTVPKENFTSCSLLNLLLQDFPELVRYRSVAFHDSNFFEQYSYNMITAPFLELNTAAPRAPLTGYASAVAAVRENYFTFRASSNCLRCFSSDFLSPTMTTVMSSYLKLSFVICETFSGVIE